ncbi:MAG: proton-conducting transporter membrane subunit [Pseudomonadota bacterium]|nr:proton-conducting transporter membrane subunit [Pseudomonadota bacterium]MEC7305120.1 proton-conducting transporter membrane subunit [Pseudomonadota bacterium]MEC7439127.1 proton-conducting transporter membrane subunit [Pseudomonadota bacterium]MEC7559336.1 proton-conducting transporter membrane subunit [Pseudomonadota bacterium]MEC7615641.1 proton-conducting transporter membrane subunit [Pseudomonadota bacterium]
MTLAQIIANLPALVVALPLLLAPVAALVPVAGAAWMLAVIGTGGALLSALLLQGAVTGGETFSYYLGSWPPPWGIEFVVDAASAFTVLVMASLAFVVTLFARSALLAEIAEADAGKAYAAWLLACGGLSGLVMTGDAFNLFVFLEISALSSVILIALGAGRDRRALIAGYNYLIIGAVGATFYVVGVGFIYAVTGSLNMVDLAERIPAVPQTTVVAVGFGFMMAGILVKAAIFPVHIWLPAAYAFAPSAVSSLLAAIATKASLYVLARVVFDVFAGVPDLTALALHYALIPLALGGIFIGTVLAIYENDIKKLLAFSSVAQIGYIALGFAVATTAGVAAGFVHIGNHALIKGGLFVAVGIYAVALGRRINLDQMVGLGRRMPITTTAFLICGLSLIGLPLTAGFISKIYLVRALLQADMIMVLVLVMASSALSVAYLWKIVEVLWQKGAETAAVRETPALYLPLWILALANIWFGVAPAPLVDAAMRAAMQLTGGA